VYSAYAVVVIEIHQILAIVQVEVGVFLEKSPLQEKTEVPRLQQID
jgi:hypothetical protein